MVNSRNETKRKQVRHHGHKRRENIKSKKRKRKGKIVCKVLWQKTCLKGKNTYLIFKQRRKENKNLKMFLLNKREMYADVE